MPDTFSPTSTSLNNVIALIDHLFEVAAAAGASDLHLEPVSQSMRIHMRVDGLMQLLEPILLLLVAIFVSSILVALYRPLFQIGQMM